MLTIENDVLVKCDENATEVVIPADVKQIKKNAFEGCKSLKTLRFYKDFDLTYEGTKEQWFKIDKGENWDGGRVSVVHCSDGDLLIGSNGDELNEKLLKAVKDYDFEQVEQMIKAGADVNAANEYGVTALMTAVSRSTNEDMIDLLIELGADVNARSKLGETPLMWCAYSKKNAVKLIEYGADVNAVNYQGASVYEKFVDFYGKDSEILEVLVQHGAKTKVPNLFIEAIKNNNTDEVLKIIKDGAKLDFSFHISSKYTPLMMAAKYDSKEVAELLIERGTEVNSPIVLKNGSYYYPLSAAAEWNAKKVAETLLKHGAEIDTDDVYDDGNPGLLPIDYAIKNNSKDIVELFLDHGYKIYNLNIWEKEIDEDSDEERWELVSTDPIAYAEEHNFTELAELLKKRLKKS